MLFTAEYPLLGTCNRFQVTMANVSMQCNCSDQLRSHLEIKQGTYLPFGSTTHIQASDVCHGCMHSLNDIDVFSVSLPCLHCAIHSAAVVSADVQRCKSAV